MCNKVHKEDLIQFIQRKSEKCLLHADEPEQRESYIFWKIMELSCNRDKKVISQVATVPFRVYRYLRNRKSKVITVYTQLCAAMQDKVHVKAVIDVGDNFATKGLTFAEHLCYVVAYKESDFGLIGCESLPEEIFAMKEAIE
ncbi:serine/threonine-protein kinase PSK2 [Tachysurus ichikawai]